MANIITGCRILCSVLLFFFPAFSPQFYALYLISGFTDMIDGTVARKANIDSKFGSKLDTIADFIFIVACLVKLLPVLNIPTWLWIWIVTIAVIKIINVISGFICQKKFVTEHTIMNKFMGVVLFLLPLTLSSIELKYTAIMVCGMATFAAIQEGHYIRSGKEV